MKKIVFSIGLFLTAFSAVAEETAGILDNPEGKKELRVTDAVPTVVCNNQTISVYNNGKSSMISITVYDAEGFVVYRSAKCMSSVADGFLLPNLDPTEDYTIVATIDGEAYVIE